MTRVVRSFLVATLVALHAAITLGGAGLHALPGFGHGSGLLPFAKNDHSHGPGKSTRAEADDCPVCQFLAQGQLNNEPATGPTAWLLTDLVPLLLPVGDLTSPVRLPIPRAPPAPHLV